MPFEFVINYFSYQDDQLKQVEKQGKPRFKVPGVYERAYWFDGNQNPMTMQRCDVSFEILSSLSISCFRFYNQRFLCSYEMMMYPFDIQAGTCNKYLSNLFSNPSSKTDSTLMLRSTQHCQIILSMAVKYDPFTSMVNPELE